MPGIIFALAIFCPVIYAGAGAPLDDYASRLNRAHLLANELADNEPSAQEVIDGMSDLKYLLPAEEDVEFDGRTIRVDNRWLHASIDGVIKIADGDIEQRRSLIFEISDRLKALKASVGVSPPPASSITRSEDPRDRIERILARPDYKADEQKESRIQQWLNRLWQILLRLLGRVSPTPGSALGPSSFAVSLFRLLILLLAIAAVIYGLAQLIKRIGFRRKGEEKPEGREVLGEAIAEDATAADLLARARELAREGDYRKAIRRAYIALLFEMEQRGKLRLHRSKTNRDYLEALRPERELYPPFSAMTGTFEKVWYGQERATEDEFNGFITRYKETVGG